MEKATDQPTTARERAAADDAPTGEPKQRVEVREPQAAQAAGEIKCPGCDQSFPTQQQLDAHRQRKMH